MLEINNRHPEHYFLCFQYFQDSNNFNTSDKVTIMKRRSFGKLLSTAGVLLPFSQSIAKSHTSKQATLSLPEIIDNGNSVEICLNSRYSFHGGYSTSTTNQIIANTLQATAAAPLLATGRTIYAALSDNLYLYNYVNGEHHLEIHTAGDKRTESTTAFEIGVATDPADAVEDAGAALHWAQLASIAFWSSGSNQPGCCPKDSAMYDANDKWNPASTIHLVNCYGRMSSVNGLTDELVAVSSDSSLSAPSTDSDMSFEHAIANIKYGTKFDPTDLSAEQISQILWASYGCTPHSIMGNAAGITVASWMYKYFITNKIYVISSNGVDNYMMRTSPTSANSKEHKLTNITNDDVRSALRGSISSLPSEAPVYFIFCGSQFSREQRLEAGYCGSSALLQTTSLGLQGHYRAQFSDNEKVAIQNACSIPSDDIPLLIFSAGKSKTTTTENHRHKKSFSGIGVSTSPNPFTSSTTFSVKHTNNLIRITIVNSRGQEITRLTKTPLSTGTETVYWNGTDKKGRIVAPGVYTCHLSSGTMKKTFHISRK